MKTLLTSVKIWAKTVFFNAVLVGVWALLKGDIIGVFFAFLFLIGGFFVTVPLLIIIDPLVKLSVRLPYSIAARIAWLFFYLVILIMFFYTVPCRMLIDIIGQALPLTGITSAALLIAILTTRKSLIKLNTQ